MNDFLKSNYLSRNDKIDKNFIDSGCDNSVVLEKFRTLHVKKLGELLNINSTLSRVDTRNVLELEVVLTVSFLQGVVRFWYDKM